MSGAPCALASVAAKEKKSAAHERAAVSGTLRFTKKRPPRVARRHRFTSLLITRPPLRSSRLKQEGMRTPRASSGRSGLTRGSNFGDLVLGNVSGGRGRESPGGVSGGLSARHAAG